ncbi:MAG TPA: hypothetical protein VFC80_04915 [Sphaerochaeta sp.]|nr:hypothetical protein [Sphaerochaeta sp.]
MQSYREGGTQEFEGSCASWAKRSTGSRYRTISFSESWIVTGEEKVIAASTIGKIICE